MDMNTKALKRHYESEKETFLANTKQDVDANFWYCLGVLNSLLIVRAIDMEKFREERLILEKAYKENKEKAE